MVIFLEEPSARAFLEGLLPRILPTDIAPHFVVFEGKQDLEKRLKKRLAGWQMPDSIFLVLRDQDAGDCREIKKRLLSICAAAGRGEALVRIACRELESWYLGDMQAVESAFGMHGMARLSARSKYRQPDSLGKPSEELRKLTHGLYQKVAGSRALGPLIDLSGNKSRSFQVFLEGIRRLIGAKSESSS